MYNSNKCVIASPWKNDTRKLASREEDRSPSSLSRPPPTVCEGLRRLGLKALVLNEHGVFRGAAEIQVSVNNALVDARCAACGSNRLARSVHPPSRPPCEACAAL
jgi:hypothetical protein